MQVFLESGSGILMIILMVAVGYFLATRGWFSEDSTKLIAKLVTQVALPPYMISSITSDFSRQELLNILPDLRFPILSMMILFIVSIFVVRLIKVRPIHRGLFESMFFNSNTVFVGLPINLAIFGRKSLPYVLVYYMANTMIFWTLGVYLIQRDGETAERMSLQAIIKKIFSAPLIGFIIGVILVILGIHLPTFLMKGCSYIGGLTIPLSMIFIGISVHTAGIKNMELNRDSLGVLSGRFVFAPFLMALLVLPSSMPVLMKQVFILQSCMPVMTNAPVVSKIYKADANFSSIMVTETTLLSLLIVPIMMVIITHLA
ncbi:putative malonate transporter [Oenococcus oeni]|uniref:AEC family transporter n=1 Tax=Oenococcus oeni TaxID=1247 RepID=UPI000951B52B|nr:AEC family transporter [Oenococcus oeni]AVI94600.1 malate transporter [Oenococcus oeni]OLQ39610.1 malate transporter [Oenococcus oeni]SYV99442.1 putative malonate transporter [Oenococcus oeni]SYW03576.1 putative malonate transporter [Oenococcus oeni]SYW19283.1 putative malonate transporter [Oenococcus oeni]